MTDAKFDRNNMPTAILASSADGITPVRLKVSPSTHAVVQDDAATGTDFGRVPGVRDSNGNAVMLGTSTDGVTPKEIYGNAANGAILVKST